MLDSVIDVWGQPVGPIFLDYLTLEDGSDRLPRNVGNYTPIYPADNPEGRRSNLIHFGTQSREFRHRCCRKWEG
jgi:hypothetical protein